MNKIKSIFGSRLLIMGGLAVLAMTVMTSSGCGNKDTKDSADATGLIAKLDSAKNETPDLTLFGLKGNVKSLKDEIDNTYKFTEQGQLDPNTPGVERDDSGRIVKMTINDREVAFIWGDDGRVAVSKSADTKNTFRYDDRGLLLSCFTEVDSWELSVYKYLKFDKNGNWTKRERQYIGLSTGAEEGEDPTYKDIDTEAREIEYY